MKTTSVMQRVFADIPVADRERVGHEICARLAELLELRPPDEAPPASDWSGFVAGATCWLESALGGDRRGGLVDIWATDREEPLASVITSLAEILCVERSRRTEYVAHRGAAPPYVIGKLLLEYAVKAKRVDEIIGALTKTYCAEVCDRLPVGCCSVLGYDLGLVPERMLEAQRAEAAWRGWENRSDLERCRYHSPSGCTIALNKTPACLGFICADLEALLIEEFGAESAGAFIEALTELRRSDIDRRVVFEALDRTIDTGERLVGRRRGE